jgi:hypothetical protein
MTHWYEEFGEFDERPDEYPEEIPDECLKEHDPELIDFKEIDITDVWWTESIKKIENPQIRQKEIEAAEKILEKQKTLDDKLESGEISKSRYGHENLVVLGREKAKFSTRCDLESVDLTYDHLGDLSEDWGILTSGNLELAEKKESLKKMIELRGPEASQELADDMLAEGKISKDTHVSISRYVREARLNEK